VARHRWNPALSSSKALCHSIFIPFSKAVAVKEARVTTAKKGHSDWSPKLILDEPESHDLVQNQFWTLKVTANSPLLPLSLTKSDNPFHSPNQ